MKVLRFVFVMATGIILLAMALGGFAQQLGQKGALAPVFRLPTLEGESLYLKDHIGKNVVILSFWASYCTPCREELPKLSKLAADYAPNGLEVYAISIDTETKRDAASVMAGEVIKGIPVLWDATGRISRLYSITAVPKLFLIGKDGHIIKVYSGFTPQRFAELERSVRALLGLQPLPVKPRSPGAGKSSSAKSPGPASKK